MGKSVEVAQLEDVINTNRESLSNNKVIKFLFEVSKLDTFLVLVEQEDELVDKKYIINKFETNA